MPHNGRYKNLSQIKVHTLMNLSESLWLFHKLIPFLHVFCTLVCYYGFFNNSPIIVNHLTTIMYVQLRV